MNHRLFLFSLGCFLEGMGAVLLIPLTMVLAEGEADAFAFGGPAVLAILMGALLLRLGKGRKHAFNVWNGAVFLLCIWLIMGFFCSLPYGLSGYLPWPDAFLEGVAGITTTGTTGLGGHWAGTFLLWRSLTQWLGGLTTLILLVAVVPVVSGVFGLTLAMRSSLEVSRSFYSQRRLIGGIFGIYVGLTAGAVLLYHWCGMEWRDAWNLACVTVSSGGAYAGAALSSYGWPLEVAVMLIMLLASGNFLLYWRFGRTHSWKVLRPDGELKAFWLMLLLFGLASSAYIWNLQEYSLGESLRYGFSHVISFASTTGLAGLPVLVWSDFEQYLFFILMFTGGCMASVTGGMKILRFLVLFKSASAEMRRTFHPRMIVHIKLDGKTVPVDMVRSVLSFFFLYLFSFFAFSLILSLSGWSPLLSMSVAAACLSNTGMEAFLTPDVAPMVTMAIWTKVFCGFVMILGRMEIFAFLVVLQAIFQNRRSQW